MHISERAVPHLRKVLGTRLRSLRLDRRLTQQRLGRRAKLSGKFIGEVERGAKSISLDSLYRVAAALSVTITALTDVPGPRMQAPGREAQRLYALLSGRRAAELRKARGVIEALFDR